jgi:adenylate kinase family enzyme
MRIHVTGNAGAGKTTLARKLGAKLDLPVIHLDQIVWAPGWKKLPPHERDKSLREITQSDSWLIEGVSGFVREIADLVIYLDVSRHVCIWRCAKRNLRYLLKSRPELPPDCPEWRIWPELLGIIWRFPALVGKRIQFEAHQSSRYVVLDNEFDARECLNGFRAAAQQKD